MPNNIVNKPEAEQIPVQNRNEPRKPYHKPKLVELGDLRSLTLGATGGGGDWSGGYFIERRFP